MSEKLIQLATEFPAVVVVGPRQSGKTTLIKAVFPEKPYVLLEDPDIREFATQDPRGFLSQYPHGAIIDEAQRVPKLFSYLQGILDEANTPGMFIVSGSQNFLLMETITQSLAGRVGILKLLPFTIHELAGSGISFEKYEQYLYQGMYPRIYDTNVSPRNFYTNYVQTYLERDLRLIKKVHDLSVFQSFLKMCAHRVGQMVNLSALANDCGITHNTARAWLSILESSFVLFFIKPHHRNYNKRLVKMPKLYFYDTGLAAYLAGIQDEEHVVHHPLKGGLFETFIMSEFMKHCYNQAQKANMFFWRDKVGHEIDCILEYGELLVPIEIKSGRTIVEDYFKNITYVKKIAKTDIEKAFVVYGGEGEQKRGVAHVFSWRGLELLLKGIS